MEVKLTSAANQLGLDDTEVKLTSASLHVRRQTRRAPFFVTRHTSLSLPLSATMKLLHKAYEAVTSLEPLDLDASEEDRTAFEATVATYSKYLGHMTAHMTGVCAASNVDPPDDLNSIEEAALRPLPTPDRRFSAITKDLDDDDSTLSAAKVIAYIHKNEKLSFLAAEQVSFARLLRGYLLVESGDLIVSYTAWRQIH